MAEMSEVDRAVSVAETAYGLKKKWKPIFDDIYRFILPYRQSSPDSSGKNVMAETFDSTAVQAAFRWAGRFQEDVTPVNRDWFVLCPGPLYPKEKRKDLERALEADNELFKLVLNTGMFQTASMEMYMDLVAGTGVLFALDGDDDGDLIDYVSAPFSECAITVDAKGRVNSVSWRKQYTAREIWDAWPQFRNKMSDALKEQAEKNADGKDFQILQSIIRNAGANDPAERWTYRLIVEKDKTLLTREHSRTCPAIVPRFFMLPGEAIGRGPAMVALPNVRVANKQVELILMAAALALFGVFTVTDDGLLNPDKARIDPGGMIMVESNASGGYNGRSIEQLNLPNNFNISDLVLQDQRAQIKGAMMDDQLPPQTGAVRSPTEIIATQRSQSFDLSAAFGRINSEYIVALIQRVEELLHKRGLIDKDLRIDQRMVMVKPTGPLAQSQNLGEVERIVRAVEIGTGVAGVELVAVTAKMEEIVARIFDLLGVSPSLMREDTDRQELMQMIAQMVAQQQQVANEAGQPGPAAQLMG
jgi:hypothetical protein